MKFLAILTRRLLFSAAIFCCLISPLSADERDFRELSGILKNIVSVTPAELERTAEIGDIWAGLFRIGRLPADSKVVEIAPGSVH